MPFAVSALLAAVILAVITPLVIVLAAIVGMGGGWLLVALVREPSPQAQRAREIELAKRSARKAVDETVQRLLSE